MLARGRDATFQLAAADLESADGRRAASIASVRDVPERSLEPPQYARLCRVLAQPSPPRGRDPGRNSRRVMRALHWQPGGRNTVQKRPVKGGERVWNRLKMQPPP